MLTAVLAFWLGATGWPVAGQDQRVAVREPVVVERGPHHRVWERTHTETLPDGTTAERKSSYTELGTGLHYLNEKGEWIETKEEIEIFQGAAIARQGQHQAIFADNLNSPGAIDLLAPDGKRFRSHVLGIAYTDYASGQSVMIADVKDCNGAVLPPNQVFYRDAFVGDCMADVRYTYTKAGFEQDIILLTAPPSPAKYGLNPETTRLEVWTEFIELPEGTMTAVALKQEADPVARRQMAEPDLVDQRLDFGVMKMEQGQAFPLGQQDPFADGTVPTGKSIERIDGRVFLIEKVDFADVRERLGQLPQAAAANPRRNLFDPANAAAPGNSRALFARALFPPKGERGVWKEKQYAKVEPNRKGLVLDYVTINGSLTNYTFKAGTTYYVTNAVDLYNTTTIEPGAIVKFPGSAGVINFRGPLDCRTARYRPAIFTGLDDDVVGEIISGSSGNPTNTYGSGNGMLVFYDTTTTFDLHDFRATYAYRAITLQTSVKANLSHLQIGKGRMALGLQNLSLVNCRNFLFYQLSLHGTVISGTPTNYSEHGTMHRVPNFRSATNGLFTLVNSLLISVTNNLVYLGTNNVTNLSDTGYFQTVAGGAYYLVNNSTNRNAGTNNINPTLLADLKRSTTEPPKTLYSTISANTNLSPVISGDTTGGDLPDLGYHYPILDFLASGAVINTNVTVLATNGVNIAIDYSQTNWGIILNQSKFISQGSATATNRIVRAHMVQESLTTNPAARAMFYDRAGVFPQTSEARLRFTEVTELSSDGYVIYSGTGLSALELTHSALYSPSLVVDISGSGTLACGATNTLWEGGGVQFGVGPTGPNTTVHLRNNLFRGVSMHFVGGSTNWTVRDNLFDSMSTNLYDHGSPVQNSFNGYYQTTNVNFSGGTNDVLLSSLVYDIGPRGYYYQPSSSLLINTGSVSAASAGLFNFTTTTNQVKETNSTVDIGLHFVALDSSGQPVDSDGDGVPDYIEDSNGNGLTDGSENSFANPVLIIAATLDYIKGGPAKRLDTNAIAYDSDSVNFNNGQLTVKITSGVEANDLLAIRNEGAGAAQIGATTNTISYGGINIATYTGGSSTNSLVISFNTNAVNASVQALVRNLTFQSISNTPANSNRVLSFTLTDGRGGTNAPTTQSINLICPAAIDAMIVIDISQSLSSNDFYTAKLAASNFVTHLNFTTDRVGLVSFAGDAHFNSPLTNNGALVQSLILSLVDSNGTRFQPPLDMARTNMSQTASNTLPLLVLLSDGRSGGPGDFYTNRVLATNAALAVKDAGIRLIAVAYGTETGTNGGTNLMKWFASSPNDFYYAPTIPEIDTNFTAIANGICRGFSLVTITNPADGALFVAPASITVGASASDSEGVAKVEFYNFGTNKLGEDASSPYSITWSSPPAGTNQLTARAIDNLGISTTSAVVKVIIRSPPSISIVAPTNAAVFASAMDLLVRASATDIDGWITNVQFFTNTVTAANVTNLPFQFAWINLTNVTNYTVQAIASDNHGYTATSAPVTFYIDSCPQVGVSNLTLSASTVVGGSNLTATVTLSDAAPAGGQVVSLLCTSPNVSIPASILVPAGANNAIFSVATYTTTNGDSASIAASTPLKTNSATLTIQAAAVPSSRFAGQCGPMDIAVVLDISPNGPGYYSAMTNGMWQMLNNIEFASGGDYRLALVAFDGTNVYVKEQFSPTNRTSFYSNITQIVIPENESHCGVSFEAINTVVNALPAAGRPQQGDFTNQFRLGVQRSILLITHTQPVGFNCGPDCRTNVDFVTPHRMAVQAALKRISISPLITTYFHTGSNFIENAVLPMGEDYAFTSGGIYQVAHPIEYPEEYYFAIGGVLSQCGADRGEVVSIRDDLQQWNHLAIGLNNSLQQAGSFNPATFDLSGLGEPVLAAQFQRTGRLRVNRGSHFDFDLGVVSIGNSNLAFFAPPTLSAQTSLLGSAYATNWNLPFPFFADIQQRLGSIYSVDLMDRVSTVCGNNFDVVDTPQSDWPAARNTLAFKTLSQFEIAQGRCRDFVLTGTNAPCSTICGGSWEILFYNRVIASQCSPHGWSVESDYSGFDGVNICAPMDALTANRYEVRFLEGGTNARSGYFSVVPSGFLPTAPVLKPLEISLPTCSSNTTVTVTVSLDAPAREQEAFVSLTVSGITNSNIPPYVQIPMGQTSTTFSFRPAPVSNDTPFKVSANYNGQREADGKVINELGSLSAPANLLANSDERQIAISWDAVPGALYYEVQRRVFPDEADPTVLAQVVSGTCFIDENPDPDPDIYNCYTIVAINSTNNAASSEVCPGFSADPVLRPRITPHGGRFDDSVLVTLTCETTNATIRYSTNGIVPSPTNGTNYSGSFFLYDSCQVIAKAYIGGTWSLDDRADFHISQPTPLGCGNTVVSMLAITNQPSVVKGSAYYGARYSFNGRRGDAVNITVLSQDFDSDLNLRDPNGVLVAQNDVAVSTGLGIRPAIGHTLRTNGPYVFEVTSAHERVTGNFSVQLNCTPSPELDVFFGATNVTNNSSFDLGLVSTGATVNLTFLLTNSGSSSLTFSSVSILPSSLFSNNPVNISSLATNSATNLTVTFNAISNGPWTGTLTLGNNDDFDDAPGGGYEFDDPFIITFDAFVNPPGGQPQVYPTSPTGSQIVTIPPTLALTAAAISTNGASVTQVQFRVSGPAGLVANGTLVSGPATNGTWQFNWADAPGGNYTLKVLAKDSGGHAAFSTNASFTVNNPPVAVDDAITVDMNSTNILDVLFNDTDPNGDPLIITNVVTAPTKGFTNLVDGVLYYTPSNNAFGRDSFQYAIADIYGAKATGTVSLVIRPSGSFYVAFYTNATQISAPSNGIEVIGITNIIGTAKSDFLDYWTLEYRRRSGPSYWTLLSTATTNVQNGLLATFDPTGLPNGQYELRVKVFDLFGTTLDSETTLILTENNKIGQFTLSFTDLQIPVSGLPITLTRTYDSRNTESGDFGFGWNLDVNSVRLEKSGIMGEGWMGSIGTGIQGSQACVYETKSHLVTVTFPDGKVFRFRAVLELNNSGAPCTGSVGVDAAWGNMAYTALPGTVGTLREIHPPTYLDLGFTGINDPITFHDANGTPTEAQTDNDAGPLYDPKEFEFTTLDGRKFQFNEAGKIVKMFDRVGNSLTFGSDGIVHTSGKSVKFIRDAAGRITDIYDPNGLNSSNQPSGPPALQFKYDSVGNLISVHRLTDRNASNPAYVTTQFGYENAKYPHYLTRIDDPRGFTGVRNEYGDDGRLKSMTDASGKTISYVHDLNGKTETIVDRLSNTSVFMYDTKGNVTNSVNALGQTNTYTFDANDNKIREVIAGVQINTFDYDGNNLLTNTVIGGLITSRFTYNQFGQVLAALDGLGHGTTNSYDALGNLLVSTNALGFTNGFTYNGAGNLTASRNALGVLTTNWFDEFGNLTNSVAGNLAASVYTYDANGNRLTETQWRQVGYDNVEALATNTFVYDAQNRVIASVDSFGNTNRVLYNELGKQQQVTDKLGHITSYYYDLRGNLTNISYPDTTFELYAYDAESRRTNSVDRAGRSTGFVLDALGRLTQTIYPDNTSTRTIYDVLGRVQFTVDARGTTNAFGYDAAGRRIASTNAWGITNVAQWSTNAYDAAGNLIATSDAFGRVTRYTYDALNQRTLTTFPDNSTQTTIYNGNGQRMGEVDQAGVTNRFGYHPSLGTLQAVTNAWGTASALWATYAFDPQGRQTNQVDALGRNTAFAFDTEGRRSRRLLPGTQSEGFAYDAAGNLLKQTNFNGQIITNLFGSQNRLLSRWHGSTQLVAFTYNAVGQRTTMSNEAGVTTFAYDKRDRLVTNSSPVGTLVYAYDENGNLTNMVSSTSGGVSIGYQYDALNRLTNVIDNRLTGTNNTTYAFDAVGNLITLKYPNAVTNLWQYDSLNRLTNLFWKNGAITNAAFAYQLGATGNRTRLDETVGGSNRVYQWSYDTLYRLKNEIITGAGPTGAVAYALDLVGNRTNRTSFLAGITTTNNYFDANDWLDNDNVATNGSAWFDANGNTRTNIGGTVTNLLYDWANRLTNANSGAVVITYDADGNRIKKTVGTTNTLYLVSPINPSGYAQVVEEFTVSGGVTNLKVYTYGLDLISQRNPNTSTNFFGMDGLGSTRVLMSMAGAVVNVFTFDAFGTLFASNSAPQTAYLFAGEQFDFDLGIYYNRARYLNQNTGRFLSRDSFEGNQSDALSLHKYLYAHANPVNRNDPLGLWENTDFGNRIQEVITDDFVAEGLAKKVYRDGNLAIGTMVGRPGVGPLAIRPDLFQRDNVDNFFFEIKSATPDQIAEGRIKVALYNSYLNYYGPWRPGSPADYMFWRGGTGPLITKDRNGLPLPGGYIAIVLPPAGGLITYIKLDPRTPKTILQWAAALIFAQAVTTLEIGATTAAVTATSVTISGMGITATASLGVAATATVSLEEEVGEAAVNAVTGGVF